MVNIADSWQQMIKQKTKLNKKASKYQATIRKRQKQSEEYLLKKLSREMGVDFGKIIEEMENRTDADRDSVRRQFDELKADVKHFATQNRRRLNQAIKTYAKRGIIEGYKKLYPNAPNIRIKYAYDWEGSCFSTPDSVGESTYSYCDVFFDQELDNDGAPVVNPGHAGLCNKFRAHCIALAGQARDGQASAIATQTLIFSCDPPSLDTSDYCAFSELWMPMSVTGLGHAEDSSRVYLHRTLSSGGSAIIRLSIRIEQDTEHGGPLLYPVTTDRTIYSDHDLGGRWIWEGINPNDWAPLPISLVLDEPYRLPPMTLLNTDSYGGGEVRVIVTLTCSATANDRSAEAEIDLAFPGFGVEIHEVFLQGTGGVGSYFP